MEITSLTYLVFVGISLLIYWNAPYRFQWYILLADSLIFYFLNAAAGSIIYVCVSVVSAWLAGKYFESEHRANRKKSVLAAVIVINVGILAVLKYTNMFIAPINTVFHTGIQPVTLLAPLAISYYTLQITAYIVDVYLGTVKAERNLLRILLFTTYFPQMVSGPIGKWSDLGTQLFTEHRFEYGRVTMGMRRILWGIAKKTVVADRLALVVDYMFTNTDLFSGIWVLIAALTFVVELYFDFSGCMDIIIGVSSCFGIKLPENFRSPFMSCTVQEFWQRWHITLGGWLRDYVMYPVSRSKVFKAWGKSCRKKYGKRGTQIPYYAAMLIVWTLMGIWHGNSWKYVICEGWYFGIIIIISQLIPGGGTATRNINGEKKNGLFLLWKIFRMARTALLFAVGNIAFRANSLKDTFVMYKSFFIFNGIEEQLRVLKSDVWRSFGGKEVLISIVIIVLAQMALDIYNYKGNSITPQSVRRIPAVYRWLCCMILTFIIILCRETGNTMFVYFQF